MFTSIDKRVPIKELIARQIEDSILSKIYPPGSKLPSENELCAQFNVSRTSVREALQILVAHRFISIKKGKGIFVNSITSDSVTDPLAKYLKLKLDRNYVIDLVHTRQMIEPEIARQAAIHHETEDIDKMKKCIEELKICKSDPQIVADYEREFHQLLAEATRNLVIPILMDPIHNMMPELKLEIFRSIEEAKDEAIVWHTRILDAVEGRDGDAAFEIMAEHLLIAEDHARKLFEMENNGDGG